MDAKRGRAEIDDRDYWDWVRCVRAAGVPIDGEELRLKGEWRFTTTSVREFPVTTTYRIAGDEKGRQP